MVLFNHQLAKQTQYNQWRRNYLKIRRSLVYFSYCKFFKVCTDTIKQVKPNFFWGGCLPSHLSPAALPFASGAILVCVSIYLYGLPKQDTSKLRQKGASSESKQNLINVWVAHPREFEAPAAAGGVLGQGTPERRRSYGIHGKHPVFALIFSKSRQILNRASQPLHRGGCDDGPKGFCFYGKQFLSLLFFF